jgi:hypothetical protein
MKQRERFAAVRVRGGRVVEQLPRDYAQGDTVVFHDGTRYRYPQGRDDLRLYPYRGEREQESDE